MRKQILIVALASLAASAVAAQQLGERIPGQRNEAGMPRRAAAPGDGMRPCPQYGPGFFKLPGSNTCARIGGEARFEYGVGGRRSSYNGSTTGTRAGVAVELDVRTETDLGPFRGVIRGQGSSDTGVMRSEPWR